MLLPRECNIPCLMRQAITRQKSLPRRWLNGMGGNTRLFGGSGNERARTGPLMGAMNYKLVPVVFKSAFRRPAEINHAEHQSQSSANHRCK